MKTLQLGTKMRVIQMDTRQNQILTLARSFSLELLAQLGERDFKEAIALNRKDRKEDPTTYERCCHSHDHCDANMVMDAAFRKAFNRELLPDDAEGMSDEDVDLFNAAWTVAKDADFNPNRIK